MNRQIRNDIEEARRQRRVRLEDVDRRARRRTYATIFAAAFVLGAILAWTITHGPTVH